MGGPEEEGPLAAKLTQRSAVLITYGARLLT
jgi:hypothetical protein